MTSNSKTTTVIEELIFLRLILRRSPCRRPNSARAASTCRQIVHPSSCRERAGPSEMLRTASVRGKRTGPPPSGYDAGPVSWKSVS